MSAPTLPVSPNAEFDPTGIAMARTSAGWEPRHVDERRMKYKPFWDMIEVPANHSGGDLHIFVQKANNRWVSNQDKAGEISVYDSFLLMRILFSPLPGTSEADLLELISNCYVEIHIQNAQAYELLLQFAQPGHGFAGATSVPSHGAPITGYAQDLGSVILGGGVHYRITLKFPNGRLNTQNKINLRGQLEGMVDTTVG